MVVVDKRKKRNGRRVCERLGVVGIGFCVESCFEKKRKKDEDGMEDEVNSF